MKDKSILSEIKRRKPWGFLLTVNQIDYAAI